MRVLRDYQIEACQAVEDAWEDGMLRPAIVLPTGAGKTDCIAKLATDTARRGGRVLALAHRSELLGQISERCQMHAPDIPVGWVQAQRNQTRRPITVAMAPTLASEKRRARLPKPDLIIIDEAHHAVSPSYMSILSWAGSFDRTRTMGVTATMARADRKGLGDVWQDVVYQKSIKWAIDKGFLVKPRGRVVVIDHLDLNSAKVSRGDYLDSELAGMVIQDVDQLVKAWQEQAAGRPTMAFLPDVASCIALTEEFERAGITARSVLGSTPQAERQEIYRDVAEGRVQVLTNCMVGTEGFDLPALACILQARPTRVPSLYQQIVGRGLRPYPGKDDCLILDVVGASRGQRLVTLIDLHETAEIDTSELDALPCSVCGGAMRGKPLTDAAQFQCTCVIEPSERDPDGGRLKLLGPATFEDHDFFQSSQLNWLFTHGGIRFLPVGDYIVTLWPEEDDELYHAGRRSSKPYGPADGAWDPAGPLPLDQARQRAEEWALEVDPSVSSRASSWRTRGGMPSEKQVAFAARLGIKEPETMNRPRLSDEISIALASRVVDL